MAIQDRISMTTTGERVREQMEKLGLSITDLAGKLGVTYEHVRNIALGNALPSKLMVKPLAEALEIDVKELEKIAVNDRIRVKFGKIPFEIAGKNPELEPIERVWDKLSDSHKKDVVAIVQSFARRDSGLKEYQKL